ARNAPSSVTIPKGNIMDRGIFSFYEFAPSFNRGIKNIKYEVKKEDGVNPPILIVTIENRFSIPKQVIKKFYEDMFSKNNMDATISLLGSNFIIDFDKNTKYGDLIN